MSFYPRIKKFIGAPVAPQWWQALVLFGGVSVVVVSLVIIGQVIRFYILGLF